MKKVNMEGVKEKKKKMPLVMALGSKIINDLGLVEKINEIVKWDKERRNVSPGGLAKVLVLSTFLDIRAPLSNVQTRFTNIDVGCLIGEEIESKDINAFNLGRALDTISEVDYDAIYETTALTAIHLYDIPTERYHSDTTTISFYGEYDMTDIDLTEQEKEELLKIERGYNKDGKPECKQVLVGQVVNEFGIPIISRAMDGNTSDVEWNKKSLEYLAKIQKDGFKKGIYVADCKMVVDDIISSMKNEETAIQFVSRCPENFEDKLQSRIIKQAYSDSKEWEDLGSFHSGANATKYLGKSYIETICEQPMRLLVLQTSSLDGKGERELLKKENAIKPLIASLEKREFVCKADAEKEIELFKKRKELKLFDSVCVVEKQITEKWPRGRRKADAKPKIIEDYKIKVVDVTRNEESCLIFEQDKSCFVIISNVIDGVSNKDLLGIYKGQQVVENSFRLLKEPQLASVIYLKNPKRIAVLTMLLTFSLLIRAIIQYRMREGLKKFNEENPGVVLKVGWQDRPLTSPTYKLLYEHAIGCYFEEVGTDEYSFSWPDEKAKRRVSTLFKLMNIEICDLLTN